MFLLPRRSPLPGWVGCAPQGNGLRLACVQRSSATRARVQWVQQAPWDDPAATLKGLRRARQWPRRRSVLLLQRHQYQLLPMDAPDVPRADWAEATRWRLKDLVDTPVEQASVDVLALPDDAAARRGAQLLAAVAPHEALRPLAAAADTAGTPWAAIDLPETALRNVSALLQPEGRAQALLHLSGEHGTLVVTHGGELVMARHIDAPAGDPEAAYDRIGLELQRTLDGFERQYSHLGLARLLVAPAPGHEALCRHVAELLYVPVQPLDLAEVLDCRAAPELAEPALLNDMLCAIGAALRD